MSKKKTSEGPTAAETAKALVIAFNAPPRDIGPAGRWGYGFERTGSKWRAYKIGMTPGVTQYLSPARGEELHSSVARIRTALADEVNAAVRGRR